MKVSVLLFVTLLLVQASTQHSISPRIANGRNTELDEFLFMASIQMGYIFTKYVHMCHGVVIDEDWILSTRVCVKATLRWGRFRAKIGLYYTEIDHAAVQSIEIDKRFVYKDNEQQNKPTNLGLFKLGDKIRNAVLVKLPPPVSNPTGNLLMLGWGRTTSGLLGNIPLTLQQGTVTIMEKQECEKLLLKLQRPMQLKNTQICVNSPEEGVAACLGDTGGPMIRYVNGEPEVVALISRSVSPCHKRERPTIGTAVAPFIRWIEETKRSQTNSTAESEVFDLEDLIHPEIETQSH